MIGRVGNKVEIAAAVSMPCQSPCRQRKMNALQ
jgi:hypothetical protein